MDFGQGQGNDKQHVNQNMHKSGSGKTSGGSNYAFVDGSSRMLPYAGSVKPVNLWATTELWRAAPVDLSDNLTDARSIKQAVEHMSDLVRDLNAATGKSKVWKGFKTLFSFLRAGANAGKLIEPVGANALGATVSLGEFVLDGAAPSQPSDVATPVASLVLDAQERLNLSVTGRRRA
jgi:prepilin-type processing-associated H-X9-DG protein